MSANISSVATYPVNLTSSPSTTDSWEMVATFWIEGVATPVVSLCGLIGIVCSQQFRTNLTSDKNTSNTNTGNIV